MPSSKPTPLQIAVFACGPVTPAQAKAASLSEGVQGTQELFSNFISDYCFKGANPYNSGGNVINPELAKITDGLQFSVWDVLGGEPCDVDEKRTFIDDDPRFPSEAILNTIDVIIISGSEASVRYWKTDSSDPSKITPDGKPVWEGKIKRLQKYLRYVIDQTDRGEKDTRVFASCFGHQILSFSCGNAVGLNPKGWEVGPTRIRLNDLGKSVFKGSQGFLTLQEIHRDYVCLNSNAGGGEYEGGPPRSEEDVVIDDSIDRVVGLDCWGKSDLTPNQGMIKFLGTQKPKEALKSAKNYFEALEKAHIFTTQGHPEFNRESMADLIQECLETADNKGGIPKDVADAALKENDRKDIEISYESIALVWWLMLKGAYEAKNGKIAL
ncbi:hypothetical protein CONPUDRAFT_170060 [Coniophora puteana RWD-64-598 SS2]|uniref:Class I glutamine amidotransferase-like protein n=1 Tax=Coniophora puteana (strain RWD-64-598) TaxID=741705 RepID=R7SI73_CONPW|nr:uncharacterized protein CONPUDRAFT_170060 [Coniophora puteana RWD-64-598 SS2]EIW74724.1 hypothetical protein CONPUDRAFT_170060 [Coniophora puteana RWD-64-598 SS2]